MVPDNLGAHAVAWAPTLKKRTEEQHALHIQIALSSQKSSPCYGVKRLCAISEHLDFHVTSGYPPDVLHDVLEGIVQMELALSFDVFIKNKYFSLSGFNNCVLQKGNGKTNCPHSVPANFATRRSVLCEDQIGGNAHENWCLLRLLLLLIGLHNI